MRSYLRNFDIVVLQETLLEKGNEKEGIRKMNKGYSWVPKTAERVKKRGRAKEGVMIGIRKGLKHGKIEE